MIRAGAGAERIWVVADHPNQLATALPLARHWRSAGRETHLLVSPHPYWAYVPDELVEPAFDSVRRFARRPGYSASLRTALASVFEIRDVRREVGRLGIDRSDVVVGLSASTFVEKAVLASTRRCRQVAILPRAAYEELTRPVDRSRYRLGRPGRYARYLVEPLSGLEPTLRLERRELPEAPVGGAEERYVREVTEVYDRVVVLLNLYEDIPEEGVPAGVAFVPFPTVLAPRPVATGRTVVFFGHPARGHALPEDEFRAKLDESVAYVRHWHPDSRLVYRPHPVEQRDEWEKLDLTGFEVEDDRTPAELYLYERLESIEAVYSVCSTSSRTAVNLGIEAYVTMDMFGFDDVRAALLRRQLGDQPAPFFVHDVSAPPVRYQSAERMAEARARLETVLDSLLGGVQAPRAVDPVTSTRPGPDPDRPPRGE